MSKERKIAIKEADIEFSIYIKRRNADSNGKVKCFTCGTVDYWNSNQIQCGHFISRKHIITRWDEMNCEPQCKICNEMKGGRPEKFKMNLLIKYSIPEVIKLVTRSKQTVKMSTADILEIRDKYSLLNKELEQKWRLSGRKHLIGLKEIQFGS